MLWCSVSPVEIPGVLSPLYAGTKREVALGRLQAGKVMEALEELELEAVSTSG